MNFELQQIKKKYGEKMAHLCRSLFPTILEDNGKLLELLESNFEPNKLLHDDIVDNDLTMRFKDYIYSLYKEDKGERVTTDKTPKDLLSEAGYDLYECETESEIQSFRKYYHYGEELCTFTQGNRLDTDYVFFAVKKDVDNIVRDDFDIPKREDLYGTSVISIQFSKGRINTLSIKNRYNHTVDNPDATFGNNLDNIIPGLRDSFENYYNFKIRQNGVELNIPNYIKAKDKIYYKYNYFIEDKYYCQNNIIIEDGIVKRDYEKGGRYLLADYFLIDFKEKTIKTYDKYVYDGINEASNDIKNIEVRKIDKKTNNIIFNKKDGTSFEMTVDKNNIIRSYTNDSIEIVPEEFFFNNKYMENISLKNAKVINNDFMGKNNNLKSINVENVETIGNIFLSENRYLEELIANKVKVIGNYFLNNNLNCINLELNNVKKIGSYCLSRNKVIKSIDFPHLTSVGNLFIDSATSLVDANVPNLETAKNSFLTMANIVEFNAPKLKEVENEFLSYDKSLEKIDCPMLETGGHDFMTRVKNLREANLPKLRILKGNCLRQADSLVNLSLDSLEEVDDHFLQEAYALDYFNAPKLRRVGNDFMSETEKIKTIRLDNLEETGHSFMRFNEVLEEAILNKLEKTGYGFIGSSNKIRNLCLTNLKVIGEDSLDEYKVKASELPKLEKVIGFNKMDISNDSNNKFYNIIMRNKYKKDIFGDKPPINNSSTKRL